MNSDNVKEFSRLIIKNLNIEEYSFSGKKGKTKNSLKKKSFRDSRTYLLMRRWYIIIKHMYTYI